MEVCGTSCLKNLNGVESKNKKMNNKPLNFLYERKGLIRRQLKAHWKGVPGFAMEHYKCNYGKHSEMCSQVGSSGRRSNLATIFICSSKY